MYSFILIVGTQDFLCP